MSFTDIKAKNQGFTIVELLIVVVVIAILAAITIVSYNGITARANSSAAAATASSLQKKAELFASDGPTGTYPRNISDLNGSAAILTVSPSQTTTSNNSWYVAQNTIKTTSSAPNASNGKDTVQYFVCGNDGTASDPADITSMTAIVGGKIVYYDFSGTTTKTISIGNTSEAAGTPKNKCIAS